MRVAALIEKSYRLTINWRSRLSVGFHLKACGVEVDFLLFVQLSCAVSHNTIHIYWKGESMRFEGQTSMFREDRGNLFIWGAVDFFLVLNKALETGNVLVYKQHSPNALSFLFSANTPLLIAFISAPRTQLCARLALLQRSQGRDAPIVSALMVCPGFASSQRRSAAARGLQGTQIYCCSADREKLLVKKRKRKASMNSG